MMKNLMLVWFSFLYNWPLLSVKGKLLGSSLYPWCSEISQCHIETWVFFHYFWGALEILFQFKNSFIFEKIPCINFLWCPLHFLYYLFLELIFSYETYTETTSYFSLYFLFLSSVFWEICSSLPFLLNILFGNPYL